MKRVSVVGTRHEEKGRANSSELLAILERIKPEIIFLEWPPAAFDAYFNGDPGNLEAIAVTRYCEDHNVDLIPVDHRHPEETSSRMTGICTGELRGRVLTTVDWSIGTART